MKLAGLGVIEFESVGKTFRDGTAAVLTRSLPLWPIMMIWPSKSSPETASSIFEGQARKCV